MKSVPIGATVEAHGILVKKSAKMPASGDSLGLLMRPGESFDDMMLCDCSEDELNDVFILCHDHYICD